MYWRSLSSPFHAPRQLRVAQRFSLRRSHYLIASNRQVVYLVYGLNLFHSRLPLCPLALAPLQFYTANRVCDRLSQMVVLFATLKRMPLFLAFLSVTKFNITQIFSRTLANKNIVTYNLLIWTRFKGDNQALNWWNKDLSLKLRFITWECFFLVLILLSAG